MATVPNLSFTFLALSHPIAEFYLAYVWLQHIQIGQTHVVAVFATEIGIRIVGHTHLDVLEAGTPQRKDFLPAAGGMKRYAQRMPQRG